MAGGNEEAKLFVAGLPDSVSEEVLKQIFEATGGNGSVTPKIFSALILSFVSITGGAIMYRLCLVRDTTNPGKFNLRWLNDKPFAKRPEALWVLALNSAWASVTPPLAPSRTMRGVVRTWMPLRTEVV